MKGEEKANDGREEEKGAINVELTGTLLPGDFGFGFALGRFEKEDDDGKGDGTDRKVDVDYSDVSTFKKSTGAVL